MKENTSKLTKFDFQVRLILILRVLFCNAVVHAEILTLIKKDQDIVKTPICYNASFSIIISRY